ncbi:hypothetical protein EIB75_01215 [Epilithonimonas vandammei]|uniref:Uncharacterized protein n=1 Tax=Epilithonimonas vandammei TaxID=2487072 RepID=A0A3G8Z9B2_9FLAO|nr:hypothetical protein [Epilithonimonas vandammei]AZI38816.1 hypothetical protein EIB74_02070 [Epilithonimonas vandammei]AZI53959.1 hypothetical protein EIB75_01215 [Epilithonimonas vandammei]
MTDIEHFIESFGLRYDKFQTPKLQGNENLNFFDATCLFFNLDAKNSLIESNIKDNYSKVIEEFTYTHQNFIFLPRTILSSSFEMILNYYLPELRNYDFQNIINKKEWIIAQALENEFEKENSYNFIYQNILNSVGYTGDIKCGFLISYAGFNYVIGFDEYTYFFNSGNLLEALILFFKSKVYIDSDARDAFNIRNTIYEGLDNETKENLFQIEKQLNEIKKSGQLLLALPVIKQLIEQNFADIRETHSHLSKIEVNLMTQQIFLPQYKNIEIKLSYLTKAVYLLFYDNPQGINLLEIKNYRDQLLSIYSSICPFDDLDKIKQSIDDITNIETKAIYTHFSRIKSTFLNLMDYEYAKHYIVTGNCHGDTYKFIPIMKTTNQNILSDEDDERACY